MYNFRSYYDLIYFNFRFIDLISITLVFIMVDFIMDFMGVGWVVRKGRGLNHNKIHHS